MLVAVLPAYSHGTALRTVSGRLDSDLTICRVVILTRKGPSGTAFDERDGHRGTYLQERQPVHKRMSLGARTMFMCRPALIGAPHPGACRGIS